MMTFTICIKTSTLTKTSHYTGYQQKLFDEIKRLKDIEGYGYKRISYILYDKGYRSIRTDSILRYNYVYSIYKKGKIREKRINRDYEIKIDNDFNTEIIMTLTSPNCPVAESLPADVKQKVLSMEGVVDADVEIVFEPAWTQDLMSEEAKLELGFL